MSFVELMTKHYMDCAAWLLDEDISGDAQWSDEAYVKAEEDCKAFLDKVGRIPEEACLQAFGLEASLGHDFWLTRNGHGCGFWETDRWTKKYGALLDAKSKEIGEAYVYEGDDGLLYFD